MSIKKAYLSPKLVRYGQVRDLTQAGTKGSTEANPSGQCKGSGTSDSSRKSCGSDRQIKEDVVHIGEHPLGIGLYLFDYKPEFRDAWGHGRQFGVMAQEVEAVMPEAICTHPDGYKMVDYGMLGISHAVH